MAPLELFKRQTARVTSTYLGRLKSGEFDPAYSPNGKQIVFTSDDSPSGYDNIFRAGITAGQPHELSIESQNEYSPSWQPLG